MDDLRLALPIGSFESVEFEVNEQIRKRLDEFDDFQSKLIYYNDNIKSLSTYGMEGRIYFEWGMPHQRITVYCGCRNCRSSLDFDPAHEQLFFELRAKEVERLVAGVNNSHGYKEKLAFLFNTKGYTPFNYRVVSANVPYDGTGNPDLAMAISKPVIDLSPKTREEIAIYNDFAIAAFHKKYREGDGFTKAYKAFNSAESIKIYEKCRTSTLDPQTLKDELINQIETHFGYPDKKNIATGRNDKTDQSDENLGLIKDLFRKFVRGTDIAMDQFPMPHLGLMHYTNTLEIFKFYRYLRFEDQAGEGSQNITVKSIQLPNSPTFKPEAIPTIFDILKDFFSPEQQEALETVLRSGRKVPTPLTFLGCGNRLADAFKQLIKADLITGCNQKELESWIAKNFNYTFRNRVTTFTLKYLNDIISTNKDLCRNPLFNVTMDRQSGNYLIRKA